MPKLQSTASLSWIWETINSALSQSSPPKAPVGKCLSAFSLINGDPAISLEPQLQNLISGRVQESSSSNQTFPLLQSKAILSYAGDANYSHCDN